MRCSSLCVTFNGCEGIGVVVGDTHHYGDRSAGDIELRSLKWIGRYHFYKRVSGVSGVRRSIFLNVIVLIRVVSLPYDGYLEDWQTVSMDQKRII